MLVIFSHRPVDLLIQHLVGGGEVLTEVGYLLVMLLVLSRGTVDLTTQLFLYPSHVNVRGVQGTNQVGIVPRVKKIHVPDNLEHHVTGNELFTSLLDGTG